MSNAPLVSETEETRTLDEEFLTSPGATVGTMAYMSPGAREGIGHEDGPVFVWDRSV